MILSIINRETNIPLLYNCAKANNIKIFEIFLSCLFHFANTYLSNQDNIGSSFVTQFFDYNECLTSILNVNKKTLNILNKNVCDSIIKFVFKSNDGSSNSNNKMTTTTVNNVILKLKKNLALQIKFQTWMKLIWTKLMQ